MVGLQSVSIRLFATQAIDELLNGVERRVVLLALLLQERERSTKLSMQFISGLAHDWQALHFSGPSSENVATMTWLPGLTVRWTI